jgi:hypothetical protein
MSSWFILSSFSKSLVFIILYIRFRVMAYLFRKTSLAQVLTMEKTVGPFLPVYLCNLYATGIPSRDGHKTGEVYCRRDDGVLQQVGD